MNLRWRPGTRVTATSPNRGGVVDPGGFRPRPEPVGQGAHAGHPGDPQRVAGVVNPHIRPQDEHAQARKKRRGEPAFADEAVSTGRIGEHAEDREHAAPRRAPGGDAGRRRADLREVGGELPLEPLDGIAAGDPQHGEVVEARDRVAGQHRASPFATGGGGQSFPVRGGFSRIQLSVR